MSSRTEDNVSLATTVQSDRTNPRHVTQAPSAQQRDWTDLRGTVPQVRQVLKARSI